MMDPAVEAVRRAIGNMPLLTQSAEEQPVLKALVADVGAAAAREALAPIRELHRRLDRATLEYTLDDRVVCSHCLGPIDWPCATARLVYTEEELS